MIQAWTYAAHWTSSRHLRGDNSAWRVEVNEKNTNCFWQSPLLFPSFCFQRSQVKQQQRWCGAKPVSYLTIKLGADLGELENSAKSFVVWVCSIKNPSSKIAFPKSSLPHYSLPFCRQFLSSKWPRSIRQSGVPSFENLVVRCCEDLQEYFCTSPKLLPWKTMLKTHRIPMDTYGVTHFFAVSSPLFVSSSFSLSLSLSLLPFFLGFFGFMPFRSAFAAAWNPSSEIPFEKLRNCFEKMKTKNYGQGSFVTKNIDICINVYVFASGNGMVSILPKLAPQPSRTKPTSHRWWQHVSGTHLHLPFPSGALASSGRPFPSLRWRPAIVLTSHLSIRQKQERCHTCGLQRPSWGLHPSWRPTTWEDPVRDEARDTHVITLLHVSKSEWTKPAVEGWFKNVET